ncbi:hypothetical protein SASPL_131256 [Salvia splendens]|uniref:Growth-regulating factor n=1 Tax=Salvia splendens TaxID=180675 RepID=A0A8X8ZKF9_SALSN|nr:hypothetical protein SASPL_131256 [Salvia splendens]
MSEKAVTTAELGYGGYRAPPFTQVQLKELEQQAIVYKYLVAGLPMPPDLVRLFRHSSDGLPACVFNQPACFCKVISFSLQNPSKCFLVWTGNATIEFIYNFIVSFIEKWICLLVVTLNYCSYYGKKFDPEPGRCRRTDGKKWRCSKDAHPDSKYCERHMHRGRNRSRKHVESQPTSQSLLTAVPHSSNGGGIDRGSSQQVPLYSGANPKGLFVGSNASKLYMGPYGISGREFSFSHEASGRAGGVDLGPSAGCGTWTLTPSHVSSSSLFKQGSDSRYLATSSAQQYMTHAFEPMNASLPKQQQHGLFGSDFSSATTLKQEHLFFSEWPTTKESWSNLDNDGSSQSTFTSTQLSMSIPRASSDFALGTAYSTNGEPEWMTRDTRGKSFVPASNCSCCILRTLFTGQQRGGGCCDTGQADQLDKLRRRAVCSSSDISEQRQFAVIITGGSWATLCISCTADWPSWEFGQAVRIEFFEVL